MTARPNHGTRRRRSVGRRGTAATELALALPLVLLLIGGTLDLGRTMHAQLVLNNAVRIGAEYGATRRVTDHTLAAWKTRITNAVLAEAAGINGFDPARLSIVISVVNDSDEHQIITVSATYTLSQVSFLASSGSPATLSQSVAWRQFR